jgi:hypothetical protein
VVLAVVASTKAAGVSSMVVTLLVASWAGEWWWGRRGQQSMKYVLCGNNYNGDRNSCGTGSCGSDSK